MQTKTTIISMMALAILMSACGSDSGMSATERAYLAEEAAEERREQRAMDKIECQLAPDAAMETLAESLTVQGGGGLKDGYVTRLKGWGKGAFGVDYILSAELTGPGVDGTYASWAVNKQMMGLGNSKVLPAAIGIDSQARTFSPYGATDSFRDMASELEEEPAYKKALACAKGEARASIPPEASVDEATTQARKLAAASINERGMELDQPAAVFTSKRDSAWVLAVAWTQNPSDPYSVWIRDGKVQGVTPGTGGDKPTDAPCDLTGYTPSRCH